MADEAKSEMKDISESAASAEFQSMIQRQSKSMVEETFTHSFDDLVPILREKINDTLNVELNPIIRNTITQVNKIKSEFNNISSEKIKIVREMKEFIVEHEKTVPSYKIIQDIKIEWESEKEKMKAEREQWSSYIDNLSNEIKILKSQIKNNNKNKNKNKNKNENISKHKEKEKEKSDYSSSNESSSDDYVSTI
jgi:hypothetical protein